MLPEILLPVSIAIMSLFWWPTAPIPFEIPKVIFFQTFVKVLAVIFAFIFLTKPKSWNTNGKIIFAILIFIIWATITSIVGVDVVKSFVGNYYRKDGLLTLYHLAGFSFLVSFFWNNNLKRKISLSFFVSSLILSIVATYEIVLHKFGLGQAATFGNPNFLAGYLAVSLPFGIYLFKESNKRIYSLGITFIGLVILFIGATAGILTLIISMILYGLFFVHNKFKLPILIFLSLISISIIGVWGRDYYVENSKSLIAEGRVRIFRNVFDGSTKKPILGYGWANIDYAFESSSWPLRLNNDVYVDKAHSEVFEILTTTGIPGIVIYIVLIVLLFSQILLSKVLMKDKLWRFTLFSLLTLYLFHAQTNVTSIVEQVIFWLVVGICLVI